MKLFLLSQTANDDYDTYDAVIVVAKNKEDARCIHPSNDNDWNGRRRVYDSWVDKKDVRVTYIGEAHPSIERGVILASFNAG